MHWKSHVLGAQKNCLIEKVLLSTSNIGFDLKIRKSISNYPLLNEGLNYRHMSHVLSTQKNHLIEKVLLSAHNVSFNSNISQLISNELLLTGCLNYLIVFICAQNIYHLPLLG